MKTIVVTGAAGGIGHAVVKKIINDELADNILALDNDIDALNIIEKEFDNIKSLSLDVTKLDEYKNIEKVIAKQRLI